MLTLKNMKWGLGIGHNHQSPILKKIKKKNILKYKNSFEFLLY